MGGEGVGDRVERGAERALAVPRRPSPGPWRGRTRCRPPRPSPAAWSGGSRARARPSSVSDDIVGADGHVERHLGRRGPVVLRRATGAAVLASLDDHVEVAAGRELVEVVAGDVGVELEPLGHLGGGDTALVLVSEEVDLAPSGIAEGGGDRGDDGGELGVSWSECRRVHAGILPIRVVQIPLRPGAAAMPTVRAGHRGAAPRRGSRAASLDRRPRHGAQRRDRRRQRGRAGRADRGRLPAAQRDHEPGRGRSRARSPACRRSASTSP